MCAARRFICRQTKRLSDSRSGNLCHIAAGISKLTGSSPTYLAASHVLELDFVERKMVRTSHSTAPT